VEKVSARTAAPPAGGDRLSDAGRLADLRDTGLLEGGSYPSLDRLVSTAVQQTGAPVALISLVDADRQVFASQVGLGEPWATQGQTPLSHSFCQHVVGDDAPLVVPDARADPRLRDNLAIEDLQVVAYAGFPLHSPGGEVLGSFCVIDTAPRRWTKQELAIVQGLATAAETEIALRAANRELLLTTERMHQVLDTANDAFVTTDADGVVTAWNAAAASLFGYAPAEAVGRPVAELIVPARFRAAHEAGLARVREEGVSILSGQRIELTAVDRAGREFPVEMALQVVQENGTPVCHAFLHDISERKAAELLQQTQHAVARALADATTAEQAATDTVAAIATALGWTCGEFWRPDDAAGTISRVCFWADPTHPLGAVTSDAPFVVPRGTGLAGIVWETDAELWIPEVADDPRTVQRRDQARAAGLHTAVGLPVRSDGRVLGVLLFLSTTVEKPGADLMATLDGVCAHLGRHLERRRAEELTLALAATRRAFDRVVAQVNDYVWTFVIRSDGQPAAVYASPDSSGIFGGQLPEDTDIATAMTEHVHPDDRAVMAGLRDTVTGGTAADAEIRVRGIDGVTRWVWIRAVPREEDGRLYVDGIATDVTARRELADRREQVLHDQQQQNQRLRELDRLKDELVALVSHELRNPLATIRGYTEMLLDDSGLTADHRQLAEVIDKHSAHMQGLVDDLLDTARIDAGQLRLEPRPVSLIRLVVDSVDARRPDAAAKRITVAVDVARHLPVHADPVRLRQVLDNLVSNAVKYTPAGGTVTVTGRHDDAGAVTTLRVTDTGIGIPPDQLPHLFDRFFRASNAVSQGIKGTGLGLAISKAIIDAHHGTITAEPAAAEGGTTFTITLPSHPPAEQ
jgi:PAS domain S-box-containing protein